MSDIQLKEKQNDGLAPANDSGKINVLEISDGLTLSELGIEERVQLFDKLSKVNPLLPKDLFMSFRGRIDDTMPTISEALIRMIVNESVAFQSSGTDHLIPHTNMLAVPVLAHQSNITLNMPDNPADNVIRVAFDIPTRVLSPDNTPRVISARTNVAIIGVKIQGCDDVISAGYIPQIDVLAAGRVRGILPTSVTTGIGLGAAQRCSSAVNHPSIDPLSYASIDGLPVKLPHQFNFSEIRQDKIPRLLQGILEWIRWVGESSYRQAVLAYHDFRVSAKNELTAQHSSIPATDTMCPENVAVFNTIGQFEIGCAFHQTTRLQLRQLGLERAYDAIIVSGKSASVPYIDAWKHARLLEQWQRTAAEKVRMDNVLIKTYVSIIEKKFGEARSKKFSDDARKMRGKPIQIIMQNTLKPSEISVVIVEYKRRQEYLDAFINNKCPHLKAARNLRVAVSDSEISTAYTSLRGYFSKTTSADKYIECNKCGFGIICPHKRVLIELDLKHVATSAMKAAISSYIGNSVPGAPLFCKICGETLSGLDALESYEAPRISHNDELAQFIWGEIAPIMRHFRFGPQIAVSQLITTVRDACYQYIFDIEKRLIISKTSSAAEILAKKKLYIDIYGFAYMILLISKNTGGQIEFRGEEQRHRIGGAPAKSAIAKAAGSKAPLIDLIKGITNTIVISRNIIIREIRGMTPETIRNTIIDAYKILSAGVGSVAIMTSNINEDNASDVLLGCVYDAFYKASVMADLMSGKRAPKSEIDVILRLPDIMGGRLEQLCKETSHAKKGESSCSIFANARTPHWNIKAPPTTSLWVQSGRKYVPLFKSAANWYFARGFELFAERVTSQLYNEPIWKPINTERLDDYGFVKYTDRIYKYKKTVQEFSSIASVVERSHKLWSCQLYKSIGENRRRRIPRLGINRIYGIDGHVHKWDKMTIGDRTLVDSDFITAIDNDQPLRARDRSDLVCSICSAKKSSTGGFENDAKIIAVLHKQVGIVNFYRFYESRCPAGGNHEWTEKSATFTCGKCSFVQGKQSTEYYDKWYTAYSAEKMELNDIGIVSTTEVKEKPKNKSSVEWSFDYNIITKFAEVFEIRPRIIMAIGIPEIIDWNSIVAGTWTPPAITFRDHPRIYAIRGIISNLVRGYNRLRMFGRIFRVPQSVIMLIESAGINRANMNTIAETLPVLPAFDEDFDTIYAQQSPAEIIEWLLEKFCDACIWFVEQTPVEPARTLMQKYVREYVTDVVKSEELTSKPGYFNWSLIYGDSIAVDETQTTPGRDRDIGDEDDQSPFSMDPYDMETGDDDDDAHANHAGDELGM